MLELALLGPPLVTKNGRPIDLKARKALALLVYLGVTRKRHTRDALSEILFPRLGRARARAGVRQCLSVLRGELGPAWIGTDGESAWLNHRDDLRLDVERVMGAVSATTRGALEEADALYRGDFLAGFFLKDAPGFDSWHRSVSDALRAAHVGILRRLIDVLLAAGEFDRATDRALRWLSLDALDESAHRALMRSYALSGRRGEALRQFERCRAVLDAEIGAAPEPETEEVRRLIAEGSTRLLQLSGHRNGEPAPRHTLRRTSTTFVGREGEIQEVIDRLRDPAVKLLTITGPAGTGKTRLSLEAALRVLPEYGDGAFFVDLAPLRDPAGVMTAVALALGVEDPPGTSSPPFDLVSDHLRHRRLLLLLDNFEHLPGASELIGRLLAGCPRLTVLVTSREPLRLQAEHTYLLSTLPPADAVRLFVHRARAARHDFALGSGDDQVVSSICARLDGLPLAIELAAGRSRFLSPRRLLAMLDSRGTSLLSGGTRDMPERHRGLWRAIEWSYELLAPSEKTLLGRLSVFPGGFAPEGAEAVWAGSPEDASNALESLVEKNLVQRSPAGDPWYVMFVAIREFAGDRLEHSGEGDEVRDRQALYYQRMAEEAEPDMDRPAGAGWCERLEREYANIRSAVEWSIDHSVERALRIGGALERFMGTQGHWRDEYDWLNRALGKASGVPGLERQRARATSALGGTNLQSAAALQRSQEAVSLWRALGDKTGLAHALHTLALNRAYWADDPGELLPILEESAALRREAQDGVGLSDTTFFQAYFIYVGGDVARAEGLTREARDLARAAQDMSRLSYCDGLFALLAVDRGEYGRAGQLVQDGLDRIRWTADRVGVFFLLCSAGCIAFLNGEPGAACDAFQEAAGYFRMEYTRTVTTACRGLAVLRENRLAEALSTFAEGLDRLLGEDSRWGRQNLCARLAGIADVRRRQGRASVAARILGGVEAVLRAPYFRLAWGPDFSLTPTLIQMEFQRIVRDVRSTLGDAAEEAFDAGRRLSLEAAAGMALCEAAGA